MWIRRNAPPRVPPRVKIRGTIKSAGVVELVDSLDLGSNARACRFESCCPHQNKIGGQASYFILVWKTESNPSKCNTPVGCCLPPAGRRQHNNVIESCCLHQKQESPSGLSCFLMIGNGLEPISMQMPGGHLPAAGWTAATQ